MSSLDATMVSMAGVGLFCQATRGGDGGSMGRFHPWVTVATSDRSDEESGAEGGLCGGEPERSRASRSIICVGRSSSVEDAPAGSGLYKARGSRAEMSGSEGIVRPPAPVLASSIAAKTGRSRSMKAPALWRR